jgi:hypothetical protein
MGRLRVITRCMLCNKLIKSRRSEARLRIDAQLIVVSCKPCKLAVNTFKNISGWSKEIGRRVDSL